MTVQGRSPEWGKITQRLGIFADIAGERLRQEGLIADGRFLYTCAGAMSNTERLAVLAEEFGEVAREVAKTLEHGEPLHPQRLRVELVQVAAVAVAWIEGLDDIPF